MMKVDNKIRVVAAVVHQNTNEIEIIIETTKNVGSLDHEEVSFKSIWIQGEDLA